MRPKSKVNEPYPGSAQPTNQTSFGNIGVGLGSHTIDHYAASLLKKYKDSSTDLHRESQRGKSTDISRGSQRGQTASFIHNNEFLNTGNIGSQLQEVNHSQDKLTDHRRSSVEREPQKSMGSHREHRQRSPRDGSSPKS